MAIYTTLAGSDDGNEVVSTGVVNNSNDGTNTLARIDGANHAAFRFPGISLASKQGILRATLKFPQLFNYTGTGTISNTTVYGHNTGDSLSVSTSSFNISARNRTHASIAGSTLNATATQFTTNGVDVTHIVQEIVDRRDWASGNALSLLFIGNGTASNFVQPYMYDYTTGFYKATLEITTATGTTLFPLTASNDTSSGSFAWTSVSNILADDTSNATVSISSGGGTTNILKASNFGFTIPPTANINGIVVEVLREGQSARDVKATLFTSAGEKGFDHSSPYQWVDAPQTMWYGSSDDIWGYNWTPTEINSSGFGFAYQAQNTTGISTLTIDYVKITVYYNNANKGYYQVVKSYQLNPNNPTLTLGNTAGTNNVKLVEAVTNNTGSTINLSRLTFRASAIYQTSGGDPKTGEGGFTYDRTGNPFKIRVFSNESDALAGTSPLYTHNGSLKSTIIEDYDVFISTPITWASSSTLYFTLLSTGVAGAGEPNFVSIVGTDHGGTDDDTTQLAKTAEADGSTSTTTTTRSIFYEAYEAQSVIAAETAYPVGDSDMTVGGYIVKYGTATMDGETDISATGSRMLFGTASMIGESSMIADRITMGGETTMSVIGAVNPIAIVKSYLYKIYDQDWNFLGVWNDIVSDFGYSQEINSAGSAIKVTLARNSDSLNASYDVLADDSSNPIITDDSSEIAAETTTINSIGPGTTVDLNLNVKIYEFNSSEQDIEGELVFTGYISMYTSQYGSTENTEVSIFSYGADLDNWVLEYDGKTRVPFLSEDPSNILKDSLNLFYAEQGIITYEGDKQKSLTFNGTSDWVPLHTSVATTMAASTTHTIAGWFRQPAVPSGQEILMAVNDSAGNNKMFIGWAAGTNRLQIYDGGGTPGWEISGGSNVSNNVWHHFVYTRSGTVGTLYVDGTSVGTHTPEYSLLSTDIWSLGQEFDAAVASDFFSGDLDDFAIWSRVLTGTEITDLYTNNVVPSSNLVIHHTFDDDLGELIIDSSANNLHTEANGDGVAHTLSSRTTYSGDESIGMTSTVVSYTFNLNTMLEVLKKCLELAPSDWFFYVDLATNLVYFKQRPTTPDHYFYLGKHILSLSLEKYIEDIVNTVYYSGGVVGVDGLGNDINLYKKYEDTASRASYRRGLVRISDNRVKLVESADIIAQNEINRQKSPRYRSKITISGSTYDIRSIKLGDLVGFRNFGNFVDEVTMQVVRIDYDGDSVTLQLDTLLPSVPKRLEDIKRNLSQEQVANNPDAPDV